MSGNPSGRPKGFASLIREKTGHNGEGLYELAAAIAKGEPVSLSGKVDLETGEELKLYPSIKERFEAVRFLAEHAHGKPAQPIQAVDEDGKTKPFGFAIVLGASDK